MARPLRIAILEHFIISHHKETKEEISLGPKLSDSFLKTHISC